MTKSMRSGCIAAGLILLMADASLAQTAASDDKGLRKQNIGTKVARPKAPDAERRARLALDVRSPTLSSSLNMVATAIWEMGWIPAGKGQSTTPASANFHT